MSTLVFSLFFALLAQATQIVCALGPNASLYNAYSDQRPTGDAMQLAGYEATLQPNAYYCGPAATRIALSAHGHRPTFDELAHSLGTTPSGTASIFEVTRLLNGVYGDERYESVELAHKGVNGRQIKKLPVGDIAPPLEMLRMRAAYHS